MKWFTVGADRQPNYTSTQLLVETARWILWDHKAKEKEFSRSDST